MKHSGLSRAIVAIAMMLIGWLPSLAHDFEINGVFYNVISTTEVEVTYKGSSYDEFYDEYNGIVVIPSLVEYGGFTYNVTSIGNEAFRWCHNLTSIEIPNSVTNIEKSAFFQCESLASIEISNSVTSIGDRAFAYCLSLTSIKIGNSVTSIGEDAFLDCSSLTSIVIDAGNSKYDSRNGCNAIIETASNTLVVGCKNTIIPNSITGIGADAFFGCSGLTSVEIPYNITNISSGAFNACTGLASIVVNPGNSKYDSRNECNAIIETASNTLIAGCKNTIIPNSVTSIGEHAFNNCSGLTSIEIPNSVTSIGTSAFVYCISLTSIEIPNSVTSIGTGAFQHCYDLTDIEIPNSVTSIGDWAFRSCSNLTSIEIPNSVTSIGNYAFYGCDNLTKITCLATTPPVIGSNTFTYYNADLYVPAGCKSAYESAEYWKNFSNIIELETELEEGATFEYEGLTYKVIVKGEELAIIASENGKYSGNIVIPSSVDYNGTNYSVTSIGASAFWSCSRLTSIEIPNSVTSIGDEAFEDCYYLTSIEIPNSITSIGEEAFLGCDDLTNIKIPKSVTSIGDYAFSGCSGLTNIVVDSGNTKYDSRNGCNAIIETASSTLIAGCQSTIIPNSVTSIGDGAFYDCYGLTSIEIPNSITSIGEEAFLGCDGLTSIEIPNSVTSIGFGLFVSCNKLTSIIVDASNTVYDSRESCNAIIETATNKLIAGCSNSKIPNSITSIGWRAFQAHKGLTSIQIPNSVTNIGVQAFWACENLKNIEIPNSVVSINDRAFTLCSSLTDVVIGNSVTYIGWQAFLLCSNLTKITCLATTPPVTYIGPVFSYYSADLYVPAGCKSAYETADFWKNFTNIIEIEEPNVNLFIEDFAINAGETKELAINLTNEIAFTGFQADLYLPDGLEIEQEEGDYIFELTDRKGSDHVITSGKQANGAIRILCFSANLNEFSGSEGAVVKFRVTAANDFVGNYEINIKDIILAQTDESEYQLPATTTKVEARMLAKSITLDQTEVRLEATQTTTLLAIILPDNTSVKTVVWTSSDEDVAVVDENGVVTAIAIGEATITATTTDGTNLSVSCKVTVVPTLGDANNDAVINVTDIMVVASYILGNTPEGFVFEAADVTKDGKINIIDIVAIANIILSSETPDETQLAARVARQTALGSRLFIDDTSIHEGETMQLAVNLTNDIAFSGFQADVKLPEGLELCQEDGEYMISLSDRKGSDHVLTSAMLSDGTIRILSYSMNLNDFAGADGALVYLTVKATQHFVGDYEISIDNITFTQADLTEYSLKPTVCRIAGTVGIEGIEAEQEAEYFNLQGLPVANPEKGGLYIIKRGNKVSKSVIK